jgi:hypothetical protein
MDDDNNGEAGGRRTFTAGEKVWVHDIRFPHSLRRATVVRAGVLDATGQPMYTVETGLGGSMQAATAQMHRLSDEPPVDGCSHCAADPHARSARRG